MRALDSVLKTAFEPFVGDQARSRIFRELIAMADKGEPVVVRPSKLPERSVPDGGLDAVRDQLRRGIDCLGVGRAVDGSSAYEVTVDRTPTSQGYRITLRHTVTKLAYVFTVSELLLAAVRQTPEMLAALCREMVTQLERMAVERRVSLVGAFTGSGDPYRVPSSDFRQIERQMNERSEFQLAELARRRAQELEARRMADIEADLKRRKREADELLRLGRQYITADFGTEPRRVSEPERKKVRARAKPLVEPPAVVDEFKTAPRRAFGRVVTGGANGEETEA